MHSEELGDYIGVESCYDFSPDVPAIVTRGGAGTSHARRSRRSDAAAMVTEYPPPIPLLAHIENVSSLVPWVMKSHRTSDGRLVITEERAPRHEYFQVLRSDGRLVLNLVPVDVEEEGCEELRDGGGEEEEKLGFPGNVADSGEEISTGDKRIGDPPPECGGFGVAMSGLMPPVHT